MEKYYVEIAKEIAEVAHAGQVDKGGNPYIQHPEFVADHLETTDEKIVGWLHDVMEDTDFDPEVLYQVFGSGIFYSLECITRMKGESWWNYIKRVANDHIAIRVKMVDLMHNMDLSRIPNPTEKDFKRVDRYKMTYKWLSGKLEEMEE